MSTPEDFLPSELRLGSLGPAVADASPPTHAPTPGVSAGVLRVPTAPTVGELDPVSLTLTLQQLANELFLAPPAAPSPESASSAPLSAGSAPSPALSSAPVAAAPPLPAPEVPAAASPIPRAAPPAPAYSEPPAGLNPFTAEPRFEGLFSPPHAELVQSVPLLDATPELPARPAHEEPAPLRYEPAYELDARVPVELPRTAGGFDAYALREEFPILKERVHGKRLVWLDNAATTQKPRAVIDRLTYFYEHENSNIHRAAHALAARATDAYEGARESVRRALNAPSVSEIIFVRGATEGINLVAQAWGRRNLEAGDEVVVTWLEHHANIVPWQQVCSERGARLKVAPVDDRGQVLLDEYEKLLTDKTKLVAFTQVSNALGTVTPAKAMVDLAHRRGARVLLDAAQAVSHMRVDVQALDCDFLVFSGHKVFAPTGIGAVYGKKEVLDAMPPWQGGGNMIQDVTFERTVFQPPPARFEAGTGNIADAVGLGAALDWLARVGIENVGRHEHDLLEYGTRKLLQVPGLTMLGTAPEKAGVLSFVLAGHSTHDVSTYLDREGIAVRGGHHCAQPILRRLGHESSVRASLAPYNVTEDLDALVDALCKLQGAAR